MMKPLITACAAVSLGLPLALVSSVPFDQVAYANTYSNLLNAQNQHAASQQREANLRKQLAGVESSLADQIVELDTLTNEQIPAAQAKVESANNAAAAAQTESDAAASRVEAARKDKENLEEKIKQTGKDYDDAHAAVAQMARESMHGSDTSDMMSVMTGAQSTKSFIQSMQSRDAISRNEANAASDAANELNTSMNRTERLEAIEKRITKLKSEADRKLATAQSTAAKAESERAQLDELRAKGESARASLEAQQSKLTSDKAKQAAQTVMLASQVDSFNRQYQKEQAEAASQVTPVGPQGPSQPVTPTPTPQPQPVTPTPTPTPTPQPVNPGGGSGGQGTANGDYGNAYAAGQCTWWAYQRRLQMGIRTPSYLGNGGQWAYTAPSYGLRVDRIPQVGAAVSFAPYQEGADPVYGHVAVVESVGANSITISEMNVQGVFVVSYRTLSNPSRFLYVH
ncbi:amidase [Bifidobacterium dolichotidis]|uniref:Amidase n=2 Tax=Bifidobacterium dolichotidis TaxID=2306976 RepID=A0A430FPV2_9BIFI|nr:amidase [Bifidobacterium dolichotidis]